MYDDEDYIERAKEDAVEITLFYEGDPSHDNTSIIFLCDQCAAYYGPILLLIGVPQAGLAYRCIDCDRPNHAEAEYEAKRKKKEEEEKS